MAGSGFYISLHLWVILLWIYRKKVCSGVTNTGFLKGSHQLSATAHYSLETHPLYYFKAMKSRQLLNDLFLVFCMPLSGKNGS